MYHYQFEEVADIKKCHHWLEKAGLKDTSEVLIMEQGQLNSTVTRTTAENKSNKAQGLPHETGPQGQDVQRGI